MKLELVLLAFLAALVPQILAQLDTRTMLSLMGSDIKLPPKPPSALVQQYYVTEQQARERALQQRRQQEMELFRRLKAMTPAELKTFQSRLSPTQLQQLVNRLKYLRQQEEQLQQSQQQQQQTSTTTGGPNMILSGANKIRRPSDAPSAAAAALRSRIQAVLAARRKQTSRRPKNPMDALKKFQSYRKNSMAAMGAGCTSPMGMETMDSFFAFSSGGCRSGGMGVCAMSGQSCVDVGMSIMCCPPGFTSGTLDMISYMNQMQQFMAQFS